MLNQQTIDKLHTMKLHGIADTFRAQLETTEANQLLPMPVGPSRRMD